METKKLNYTFEISEEAFEFLKSLEEGKWIEYRDTKFKTLNDFLASEDYKQRLRTLEWFKSRNEGGTYSLCEELANNDFVEDVEDSWHTTYKISDFGKKILELNR